MIQVLVNTARSDLSKFKECVYHHDALKHLRGWLKNAKKKLIKNKEGLPNKTPEAEVITGILDLLLQNLRVDTESQFEKIKKSKVAVRVISLFSSTRNKASAENREYPKFAISSTITVPAFSISHIFLS